MKYNICLVTEDFNEGRGGYILKKNLIKVLTEINDSKIIVIDSNFYIPKQFILLKLISILIIQLKNTIKLLKNLKNINVVIFTSGATFILPMFFSKISNKTTIYFISGLTGNELKKVSNIIYKNSIFGLGGVVLSNLFFFFENILIKLADNIILESPSIKNNNFYLSKLNKPVFNGSLFIDTYKFYPKNNFKFRKPIICFFGALTKYKGINVLLNSIPIILSNEDVIFYIIGGSTQNKDDIEKIIQKCFKIYDKKIILNNTIPHEKVSQYLNQCKILILPSYGEGLPNIVLEAMACGVIVLATSVGGIPDIIKEGETGFILEKNIPEYVAEKIHDILTNPNLPQISYNAVSLIKKEYVFDASLKRYKKIFNEIKIK